MATPTNPSLINQLVEVGSPNAADLFLLEQGGVFKKITATNLGAVGGAAWVPDGLNISYIEDAVGVGLSAPVAAFDVDGVLLSKNTAVFSFSPDADSKEILTFVDNAGGAGRKLGFQLFETNDADSSPRVSHFLDIDEDSLNYSFGDTTDIRLKFLSNGGIVLVNLPTSDPGVTGDLWNNAGTLTQSP